MKLLFAAFALTMLAAACSGSSPKPLPSASSASNPTTTAEPPASPAGAAPSVRDVSMAPDGGLPPGSALLIGTAGFHHGSAGFFRLRKAWQLSSGGPTSSTEVIPWNGSPDPNRSNILGVVQSEDGTVLWMARCDGGGCFTSGPAPGTTTTFLRSLDGGVSWQELLRRDGAWWLRASVGQKAYAVNYEGTTAVVMEVPSGDAVAVPPGAEASYELMPSQGKLAWVARDRRSLVDAAGLVVVPFTIPATLELMDASASWTTPAGSLTAWELHGTVGSQAPYIAIVKAGSPTPIALLHLPIGADLSRWLDGDSLVLAADYTGGCAGSFPVLLSVSAATARFVIDEVVNCAHAGGQVVVAAWSGLSGQVHTPGDCLNLRQRPEADAPVLECLADGVLLQVIGKDGVPAGWLPVTAPSGASGWVNDGFVARQ